MSMEAQELWMNVRDGLHGFLSKRVSDPAQVDDLLQEVFLRMHRKLGHLKDPRKLVPWLYQITRHAIIDHYRAQARKREVAVGLSADLDTALPTSVVGRSAPESGRLRAELAACLGPMIKRLSPRCRDAIMLVEIDGLTQHAAAHRLGLSVPGMKSRVQRGRRHLKRMLDECCEIHLDRRRRVTGYQARAPRSGPCGCRDDLNGDQESGDFASS